MEAAANPSCFKTSPGRSPCWWMATRWTSTCICAADSSALTQAANTVVTSASSLDTIAIQERCPRRFGSREVYERLSALGVEYGPAFRLIQELWVGDGEALARIGRA